MAIFLGFQILVNLCFHIVDIGDKPNLTVANMRKGGKKAMVYLFLISTTVLLGVLLWLSLDSGKKND